MTELSSTVSIQSQRDWRWKTRWFEDVCFGLLPALALAPLVCLEFMQLWDRVHMRFFPLPIIAVLAFVAWNWKSNRNDSAKRASVAHGFQIIAAVLLLVNWSSSSPWIAYLCLILVFAGWSLQRFGDVPWPRVAAWCFLLATTLRLPANCDEYLLAWLEQTGTSVVALVLDGLSQPFLINAGKMTVSGADPLHVLAFDITSTVRSALSMYALSCLCVLLLIIRRRSLVAGAATLLTIPFWYLALVVIQLLSIISVMHFMGIDLSAGRKLMALSIITFALVLGLMWLSDRFIAKLLYPVPAFDSEFEVEFRILNSLMVWPQQDPFEEEDVHQSIRAKTKKFRPSPRWEYANLIVRRVCLTSLFLGMAISLLITNRAIAVARSVRKLPTVTNAMLVAVGSKDSLPTEFAGWKMVDFAPELRNSKGIELGVLKWRFAWQDQIVELKVTFPFSSTPNPADEFTQLGWRVIEQQQMKVTKGKDEASPDTNGALSNWMEVKLESELGGSGLALASDRVLGRISELESSPQKLHYQVSLLCESGDELSTDQLKSLRQSFQLAIAQILNSIDAQIAKVVEDSR